jgi:Ca2+-binding RTX toxin-like protein
MAHVKIKLSEKALDHLIATSQTTTSLTDSVSALLGINTQLNQQFYYFNSYTSSSSQVRLKFDDGATRIYNGIVTPTHNDTYYEYGNATANTVVLNIPAGIRETVTGSLNYSYAADAYGDLSFNYTGGYITQYKVDIFGKLADVNYGNLSSSLFGQINQSITGELNGVLSKLHTTAQKIEKTNIVEGSFNISGNILSGVTVSGTLNKLRTEFHDKSFFELNGSREILTNTKIDLMTLRDENSWQENDIFEIELANNATKTLRINSGAGNDHLTLKGGRGLLIIDAGDGDDTIRLLDSDPVIRGGDGVDTIETSFSYSIEALSDIENLTIYGNKKADATGNALDNVLRGNAAANILDGKSGADQMIGGGGNDTYIVDHISDETIELANQGIDTVKAWLTWTLAEHLENLELLGNSHINGTGNSATNKITGNAGNNILDGAEGVDTLIGGAGDDTYIVDLVIRGSGTKATVTLQDKVIEATNNGVDTLQLRGEFDLANATTLRLANNLEGLDASNTGSTRLNLTGNTADNTIIGNAADNIIIGGAGADIMTGGAGADTFRFLSLSDFGLDERQDVILDFTKGEDLLDFKALKGYSFIGEQAFTGIKQLRYETDNNSLTLYGNATGDQQPEFSLKLIGISSLSSADLILA